ncbi:MAG: glutamine-hydrolyzing GMP synthase [Bacteroidia bacterium]
MIGILHLGSQYTQLIAKRLRTQGIYCEIFWPGSFTMETMASIKGLILSGSPEGVGTGPEIPTWAVGKVPTLGICYGAQWVAALLGGKIAYDTYREYGAAEIEIIQSDAHLFRGLPARFEVWMSHADAIETLPPQAEKIAQSENSPVAAYYVPSLQFYGLQFHPEVEHTEHGSVLLYRFAVEVCGEPATWKPESQIPRLVAQVRAQISEGKVLCALSGGIDSTVAALIVQRAVGERLHAYFVNTGLLRLGEYEEVLRSYAQLGLPVKGIQAASRFYRALRGITDPEKKRKAIGALFIEILEAEAKSLGDVAYLVQGTIYPDVIESGASVGAHLIKSHHNVGGLPATIQLQVIEPLRSLFKDEVRQIGQHLGLPEHFLRRHPFPGPGLAVRIIGKVTPQRVALLQKIDAIFLDVLRRRGWYDEVWQAFAVLLPIRSVGVGGDGRRYGETVILRAVQSQEGMTARAAALPFEVLEEAMYRVTREVPEISRVAYDVTSKPPGTIEWE